MQCLIFMNKSLLCKRSLKNKCKKLFHKFKDAHFFVDSTTNFELGRAYFVFFKKGMTLLCWLSMYLGCIAVLIQIVSISFVG